MDIKLQKTFFGKKKKKDNQKENQSVPCNNNIHVFAGSHLSNLRWLMTSLSTKLNYVTF